MKNGKAVGAFNTSNMEVTQAIIMAANDLKMPCIIQSTASTMEYTNDTIGDMVRSNIDRLGQNTEIGFHLDHGHSMADVIRAIDLGMDSVMIDASRLIFEENMAVTKKVVDYAHSKGVAVQAELGKVPYLGKENLEVNWPEIMTNPEEAEKMVKETGVDVLAVGIGNAHGFFKERPVPDWDRLKEIRKRIPKTPLIMHGASDWSEKKAKKAISLGVSAFNIDTDTRLAFCGAICKELVGKEHCEINDPRKVLGIAREEAQKAVKKKIKMFALVD